MSNFSEISNRYEEDSLVQKSAGQILFDLLDIQSNDDMLDLGCGTGHISRQIRNKTKGKVVGVDLSGGMIEKAIEKFSSQDIIFRQCPAHQIDYHNDFDVIFCNSAFQWFNPPYKVIDACYDALRINGRMAIQAPAKDKYCPNFLKAIEDVSTNSATKEIFCHFKPPWFFRNNAKEYAELFENAGFKVIKSTIDKVTTYHTGEEAYKIFESGAAAGYLNQDYYSTEISQDYIESFRKIVKDSFCSQAGDENKVKVTFYRIYLLAIKQ